MQDELLTRAGFRGAGERYALKRWDMLPLETLLANPPDVIFTPTVGGGEDARAIAVRLRLLGKLKNPPRIVEFPDRLMNCGGPTILEVMTILRRAA